MNQPERIPAVACLPRMARSALLAATLLAPAATMAQSGNNPASDRASNTGPADTQSLIAPSLPVPELGPDADPADFLRAARVALATGRTGEAQEALERGETRLLDRSTPLFQTRDPSGNPLVAKMAEARQALGAGDTSRAMQAIEAALAIAGHDPGRG